MHSLQIVFTLELYGVKKIVGIQYGYRGLFDRGLAEIEVRAAFLSPSLGLEYILSTLEVVILFFSFSVKWFKTLILPVEVCLEFPVEVLISVRL